MSDYSGEIHGDAYERWQAPNMDVEVPIQPNVEQLEAVEELARQEGYAAGHREGLAVAKKEIDRRAAQLDAIMQAMANPLASIDEAVEQQIVQISISIARQLIRRELMHHPDEIVPVVREAVAALPPADSQVIIHAHPEDVRLLRETIASDDDQSMWRFQEDLSLTRGGCRVESGYAQADARLETRVQDVITRLLGGDRIGDLADQNANDNVRPKD